MSLLVAPHADAAVCRTTTGGIDTFRAAAATEIGRFVRRSISRLGTADSVEEHRLHRILRSLLWSVGAGLMVVVCASASPARADAPIDIRGSWDFVCTVGASQFPQTIVFVTEDVTSGAVTGNDSGGGSSFAVTGTMSGSTLTWHTQQTGGGYTSDAVSTVSGNGVGLTMTGSFTDSNGVRDGRCTGTRTTAAAAVSPAPPVSTTDNATTVPGTTPSPDSNNDSSSSWPEIAAAAAALAALAGLGLAAAKGRLPGQNAKGNEPAAEKVDPSSPSPGPGEVTFDPTTQQNYADVGGKLTAIGTQAQLQQALAQQGNPPAGSELYQQTVQDTMQSWTQQATSPAVAPSALPPQVTFDPTTQQYYADIGGKPTAIGSHADLQQALAQQGNPPPGSELYQQTVQTTMQSWTQQATTIPTAPTSSSTPIVGDP